MSGQQRSAAPTQHQTWRVGRRSMVLLLAVVLLGLSGTGLAVAALKRVDQDRAAQALDDRTQSVAQSVAAEVRRYGWALTDMAAAVGAQTSLQASEFTAITAPIDRGRLPGTTGVSLVVPASTAQVSQVQAYWRARGAAGLLLHPDPGTEDHLFVVLIHSLDTTPVTTGRDLHSAPVAVAALEQARTSRIVTASHPYLFLRDAALPKDRQQLSLILAAAIYATSPPAQRGQFRGWMVLGIRGTAFLRQSIGVVARTSVAVTDSDTGDSTASILASWQPPGAVIDPRTSRTVTVDAAQQRWQLHVEATNRLTGTNLHLTSAAMIIGLIITVLLAVLTATVTTSRDRALRRVEHATEALRDDIAHRKLVEEQLRLREAELVGFAGVIAHDLRGPLSRISGYTDFLREEAAPYLNQEHQNFLERVRNGTAAMQTLLDDLLDYATADNRGLKTGPVSLDTLVAEIITERTGTPTDLVPLLIVGPLPVVDGDRILLRQVFDNLIGNALKYARHGRPPHVEITAGVDPDPHRCRIEISDRGIGIAAEHRAQVFTAFTRVAGSEGYPGTGLGLAIVHRIIERHHGQIGVDGNEHGGSLFWITLPAPSPTSPAHTAITATA